MRFEEGLEFLTKVEREVGNGDTRDADAMNCECQVIRSVIVALMDDTQSALSIVEGCAENSTDTWTVNVASNVARLCHWKAGDLYKFHATPWIPFSDDEDKRNVFASVYRLCFKGLVEFQQLRSLSGRALLHRRHAIGGTACRAEHRCRGLARQPHRPDPLRTGPDG